MVVASTACYRLTSESTDQPIPSWRFRLNEIDGDHQLEIIDREPGCCSERLGLLAVVRGLEAIDRPSCVCLATSSRYVYEGIAFGLDEWRENDWRWECFGRLVPIKNLDLWQRIDRALQYHEVASLEMIQAEDKNSSGPSDPVEQPSNDIDPTTHRRRLATSIRVHRLTLHARMWAQGLAATVEPVVPSFASTARISTSWRLEQSIKLANRGTDSVGTPSHSARTR